MTSSTTQSEENATCQHSFGNWVIVVNATCIQDGEAIRKCSECNYTEKLAIPAKGHTVIKDVAIAATCKSEGKTEGSHCLNCGEVLIAQETIPPSHKLIMLDDNIFLYRHGCARYKCSICEQAIVKNLMGEELEVADLLYSKDGTVVLGCLNLETANCLIIPSSVLEFENNQLFNFSGIRYGNL